MKKKKWLRIVLLAAVLLLGAEIIRSNFCLRTEYLRIQTDGITEPLRIVHLSDLHNAAFGQDNGDLLAAVAEQKPDLIFFTGDLVTGTVEETETARRLLEELVPIAPVYVCIGNHEQRHERRFGTDLAALYEQTGATVLEFEYEDVTVGNNRLRIGGLSGYCLPEFYLPTGAAKVAECEFLKEMADTELTTLLLCHIPVSWIRSNAISYWDMDYVFSGHLHGGQWNLPLLGPVVAPDMGWFPERTDGVFFSGDGQKQLIVSRGLGNSKPVFRLNNPPQILVVDMLPA